MRTNCFGTNVLCDVARQVGVERFLHISTDEVYGSIEEGSFSEDRPPRPALAVLGGQGRQRPDRAQLLHDPRAAGGRHPVQQQLRAVPVPREGRSRCSPPTCSTASRCRCTATAATSATGSTWTTTTRAADLVLRKGERRRDLQHRRRQRDHEQGAHQPAARADRARRELHRAGRRSARSRPPLLDHPRQGRRRSGGRRERTLDEAWPTRSSGTATNREWWEPLKAAPRLTVASRRVAGRRVLVTGAGGQLGHDMVLACTAAGDEVIACDHVDARHHRPRRRCSARSRRSRPTSSSTARRGPRSTPARATRTGPSRRTRCRCGGSPRRASAVGAHLVHISTDYVFDGTLDRPYHEWDEPNPASVYGADEAGRRARGGRARRRARRSCARRGCAAQHGNNMVKTVLRLAAQHPTPVVRRRPGRPPDVHRRPRADAAPPRRRPPQRHHPPDEPDADELVRVRHAGRRR